MVFQGIVFQRSFEDLEDTLKLCALDSSSVFTYVNKFSLDLNEKQRFYAKMTSPFFVSYNKNDFSRRKKEKEKKGCVI
jgi:hypothetical protein